MADPHSPGTLITPSFGVDHGLDVVDPIERLRRTIRTAEPIDPEPIDGDVFALPVESAVEIETSGLTLPLESQVYVRDGDGHMIDEVQLGSTRSFPEGTYCIEPTWILKVYLRVESGVEIRQKGNTTEIEFDDVVSVRVGSCSTHERPAATVTVTEDPADVLAGISTFGSALKTLSPERSFPTHRGHPPTIELGEERDIPEGLTPPAEDVHVEVPGDLAAAFAVAPLAYYLGAGVREGPVARIVGESIDYPLAHRGNLEDGVERTLGKLFLLDCVTRTEGIYQLDLHERELFEQRIDLPLADLYDAPHAERLASYLEVPYDQIADLLPDWKQVAHVDPSVDAVEALPYLVDDLSIVKTEDPDPVPAEELQNGGMQGRLMRGDVATETSFVHPVQSETAIEETWVGDGTPLGVSKALPEAFENRVGRSTSTGSIDISVICNDPEMADEEDVVDDTYGSRSELPFDVTVETDTTKAELADLLAEDRDFLHYIGHIDDDGFRCSDGRLDATTIDEAGMDAFFLNACQSYEQGMELVRKGAIGGIVTVRDVANMGAVRIGQAVARLLNCGFPLRPALNVARDESVIGSHYIVIGDGGLSIVQPESGTPHLLEIGKSGDEYQIDIDLFGAHPGMGGLFCPHLQGNDDRTQYYLASGNVSNVDIPAEDFEEFLHRETCPVRRNGFLSWSNELTASDF
ncbi:hypothetical protein GCM10028857_23340 [Salinarchaeum chitinilyticum]